MSRKRILLCRFDSENQSLVKALVDVRNSLDQHKCSRMVRPFGQSKRQVIESIKTKESSTDFYFSIQNSQSSDIVGIIQAVWDDSVSGALELGLYIFESFQRQGYGRESVTMLLEFLRLNYNARKFIVRILSTNTQSLRLFESLGFTECGVLSKHYFVNGDFDDVILLERF